jgi:hypothetical protein
MEGLTLADCPKFDDLFSGWMKNPDGVPPIGDGEVVSFRALLASGVSSHLVLLLKAPLS